jgi:hypothetical protein
MRKVILFTVFTFLIHFSFAQSFFKPLPKRQHVVTTNLRFSPTVTSTDSTFFAFRPEGNIAALSIPSFQAMAGAGFGVQNITYNFLTQRYYCNYSINAVMFAGGNISPSVPTATLTYALMIGALNNMIMAGAGVNGGKAQFIVSIGILFNN